MKATASGMCQFSRALKKMKKSPLKWFLLLRILAGKTHPQVKLKRLRKVCIWTFAGTSNQLFIRGFYTEIRFTKIIKQLVVKVRSLWYIHFILLKSSATETWTRRNTICNISHYNIVLRLLLCAPNAVYV